MATLSLTDLIAQTAQVAEQLQKSGQAQLAKFAELEKSLSLEKTNTSAAVRDAELVAATKLAAEQESQRARLKLGTAFGTNALAQNEIYSALAQKEAAAWQEQQTAKAAIDAKTQINPLTNPIGYIMGQLTVDRDIARHNSANQQRQAIVSRIEQLNSITQSSAQIQNNFAQTVTQDSADAATRLASFQLRTKQGELDREAVRTNLEGIRAVSQIPVQQLGLYFQAKSAQNADMSLALSKAAAGREERRLKLAEARDKVAQKGDVESESIVASWINEGRALRGAPELTGVKLKELMTALRSGVKTPFVQELQFDMQKGQEVSMNGASRVRLADSPAEMIALQQAGITINASPEQSVVMERLKAAIPLANSPRITGNKPIDPKDKAGAATRLNAAVDLVVKEDLRNAKIGAGDSMYSIPSIQDLAKVFPDIATNPVYTKVLKARLDAGEKFEDPSKVVIAISEAQKKGEISYNEAIRASEIFARGVARNNEARTFTRFGIPAATTFVTSVDTTPLTPFSGSENVDLLKPESLGRALLKIQMNSRASAVFKPLESSTGVGNLIPAAGDAFRYLTNPAGN